MNPKTKAGRLTRYGLACGYIERAERSNSVGESWTATLLMEGSVVRIDTFWIDSSGGHQRGSMPGGRTCARRGTALRGYAASGV